MKATAALRAWGPELVGGAVSLGDVLAGWGEGITQVLGQAGSREGCEMDALIGGERGTTGGGRRGRDIDGVLARTGLSSMVYSWGAGMGTSGGVT